MPESDDTTDWRVLREFAAVDLERSFVLSWKLESDTLLIDVDLFLMPEHPFYEKPRPAEKVCIRPAVIEFPLCDRVEAGDVPAKTKPSPGAAELGHGAIGGFRRLADGRFEMNGEFGVVLIDAERPLLRFKGL